MKRTGFKGGIGLATLLIAGRLAAAGALSVVDTPLGKPEAGSIPDSFVVSRDHSSYAYVAAGKDQQSVIINGTIHGPYKGVGLGTPAFNAEGTNVAYVALQPEGSVLHLNGQAGKAFAGIDRLRFSEDGRRHAIVVESAERVRPVVDGVTGPEYERIGEGDPVFSADGRHVAYAARRAGKWVLVEDGREGPEFDALGRGPSYYSRDGKTSVYLGVRANRYTVVINGVIGREYDLVSDIVMSDTGVVGYRAVRGKDEFVVFDGREGIRHEAVVVGSLTVSRDGRHFGFAMKEGDGVRMVLDGAEGPIVHQVGPVAFDKSGARSAYKAILDLDAFMILDGKPGPKYSMLGADSAVFSEDGRRVAYSAQKGARWHVVVDQSLFGPYEGIGVGTLCFSADGKHWAVWAKRGIRSVLVADGRESGEYRTYLGRQKPWFSPDGAVIATALKDEQIVRLRAPLETGPGSN